MRNNLGKICFTLAALLLSSTTALKANDCAEYVYVPCETDILCECANGKATVFGDFLYLRAAQNGLDYCFSDGFTIDNIGGVVEYNFNSKIKDPDFKWRPAYRVGAAWEFNNCNWDIVGVWTHLNSHSHAHLGEQNVHWDLDYDVADLLLNNRFYDSCALSLNVFGGVKLAWIDQKTRSFRTNDFLEIQKIDRNKQDFFGAGPMIGLGLNYGISCGFSVYADAAVAALYGCFHNRFHNTVISDIDIRNQNIRQHTNAYQGVFDAGLGVRWDHELCNKKVFLKAGLEMHRYFSYNRLGDHDDLCLDGVSVGAGFEF